MKVYYPGKNVIKIDKRRTWLICDNCHEVREMVVEDLFYDGFDYRFKGRCVNCGEVLSIDIKWDGRRK